MSLSINMSGGSVSINGKSYSGNNISIVDGNVIVDGDITGTIQNCGTINVIVNGDVHSLSTVVGDVTVQGNCGDVRTTSGDVLVNGSVSGNVKSVSGDIISRK